VSPQTAAAAASAKKADAPAEVRKDVVLEKAGVLRRSRNQSNVGSAYPCRGSKLSQQTFHEAPVQRPVP